MNKNECPFKNLVEPNGPTELPFVNSFPFVAWDTLKFLKTLQRQYGDISKYKLFGFTNYLVTHPDDIASVFKGESKGEYAKKRFHNAFYPFFGNGLFNSYGKDWEKQRKQLQPFFNKSNLPNWFPLVAEETINNFEHIDTNISEHRAEDIVQPLIQAIMSRILFGLKLEDKDSKSAFSAIEQASEKLADHGLKSFFFNGILNKFPTPGNIKYKATLKTIDASIKNISGKKGRKEDNALLPLFKQFMTPKELRDQLFTLYFAGQETTVSTLLWVIYYLAKQPENQEKARQEVLQYWPNPNEIDFDDLDNFVFLNAAIDEAMRLSPAAYVTYRDVEKDTELGRYRLKENALLILSMHVTHRHPDLWEKPSEYRPERFLGRKNKGFSFYPYGGGKRVCLGMHLARMEITTIIAIFVTAFEFKLKPGAKVTPVTHMTQKPKKAVPLVLKSTGYSNNK